MNMNKTNTPRALSIAIEHAYETLLNNDIDEFLEIFNKIDIKVEKTSDDNLLLLKLINDVNRLVLLIDEKNEILSQNIKNSRKQIKAYRSYHSLY